MKQDAGQEWIDYPKQEEIDKSISNILENAYLEKTNLLELILNMYRQIGICNILHGMKLLLGIIFMCYIGFFLFGERMADLREGALELYMMLFLPLVFQGILGLSLWNEEEMNVYELGMTCKYTLYHILALRMVAVSIFLILLNGGVCVALRLLQINEQFMQTAFLAVTITLLYGVLYLKVLNKGIQLIRQIILYGAWAASTLLISKCIPALFAYVVFQLPFIVHVFIWCLSLALFGQELSRFLNCNCKYNLYVGGLMEYVNIRKCD